MHFTKAILPHLTGPERGAIFLGLALFCLGVSLWFTRRK